MSLLVFFFFLSLLLKRSSTQTWDFGEVGGNMKTNPTHKTLAYLLIYNCMHQTQCHSVPDGYTQQHD